MADIEFANIVNNLNAGVALIDVELKIYYWNSWLELYTKIDKTEANNKSLDTLFNLKEREIKLIKRHINSVLVLNTPSFFKANIHKYVIPIQNKRFTQSYFDKMQQDVTIIPYDKSSSKVAIIVYDQTDVMDLQQRLIEQSKDLEKLIDLEIEKQKHKDELLIQQNRLAIMGEMVSMIAHQWRQPLNVLTLIIQDIDEAYKLNELNSEYLEKSVKTSLNSIKFLTKTVEDFRSFFKQNKNRQLFSVKNAIESLLGFMFAVYKAQGINVVVTGADFYLNSFEGEFKQIMLNLLNNAKDAILESCKKEKIVEIILDKPTIEIRDSGNGISSENFDKLFTQHFTTKGKDGTGIGLYMSKKIIESSLNGVIEASNWANGASFKLIFKSDGVN